MAVCNTLLFFVECLLLWTALCSRRFWFCTGILIHSKYVHSCVSNELLNCWVRCFHIAFSFHNHCKFPSKSLPTANMLFLFQGYSSYCYVWLKLLIKCFRLTFPPLQTSHWKLSLIPLLHQQGILYQKLAVNIGKVANKYLKENKQTKKQHQPMLVWLSTNCESLAIIQLKSSGVFFFFLKHN